MTDRGAVFLLALGWLMTWTGGVCIGWAVRGVIQ
jgi:hypothetical protein